MRVAYIAGPYRARTPYGISCNINKASDVAAKYWLKGFAVICPHKNSAMFDGLAPDNVWLDGYLEIMCRCDVVVMMSGWQLSTGAKAEHDEAISLGLEVIYDGDEK